MKNLEELTQDEMLETTGGCWLCATFICIGIAYIIGKVTDKI